MLASTIFQLVSVNLVGDDDDARQPRSAWRPPQSGLLEGTVLVTSADPTVDPAIDEDLLSLETDLIRMRDGVKRLWEISRQPAIAAITTSVIASRTKRDMTTLPKRCRVRELDAARGDRQCPCLRHMPNGRSRDPRSVVDPLCRVIGVDSLRVVDASIIPDVPRANTHLSAVMVGEHAAALMRSQTRSSLATITT